MLQHESGPCGVFWTYDDPLLSAWLSFIEDMDTVVAPPASLIKFDIDDVQESAISFDWVTDRCFKTTYSEAALGPVDVDLKTLTTHPNFKTALGELIFPFDQQCYELDLDVYHMYVDPVLVVYVDFQSDMDTSVIPLPADLILTVSGVVKVIDTITWDSVRSLKIRYSEALLSTGEIDLELPDETDLLRCSLGSVIPSFLFEDIRSL